MLFNDFEAKLLEGEEEIVVVVGDLFEKPTTSIENLARTVGIFTTVSQTRPERQFYILAGNHDLDPDSEKRGSFHILYDMQSAFDNIEFLLTPTVREGIAMFPWEWGRSATEQLEDLREETFHTAIGHWDLETFGDHDDHLCPAKDLQAMGAKEIYSGHWHVAGDYKVDDVNVVCTGSMQPMTHAEDPDGKMYITLKRDAYLATDPAKFKDMNVRVFIDRGDVIDPPPTCLSFKTEYNDENRILAPVKVENFDLNAVVTTALNEKKVTPQVRKYIMERIDAAA